MHCGGLVSRSSLDAACLCFRGRDGQHRPGLWHLGVGTPSLRFDLAFVGIGINSLLSAVISAMMTLAKNEQELRGIVFWLQGGLDARTWEHVSLIARRSCWGLRSPSSTAVI